MRKAQEKGSTGSFFADLAHRVRTSSDVHSSSLPSSSVTSSNQKSPYGSFSNSPPSKGKTIDNKDSDNPKKKNRRKERHRNRKYFQEVDLDPSTSSTSPSSPSRGKPDASSSIIDSVPIIHRTKERHSINHFPAPTISENSVNKKKSALERAFERLALGKKSIHQDSPRVSEPKFSFKIFQVKPPQDSFLFKKRSSQHKYVNLRSFVKSSSPYVFKTSIHNFVSKTFNSALLSKAKRRKYPVQNEIKLESGSPTTSGCEDRTNLADSNNEDLIDNDKKKQPTERQLKDHSIEKRNVQVTPETNRRSLTSTPKKWRTRPKGEKFLQNKLFKKRTKAVEKKFPEYVTEEEVKIGLANGDLVKGFLRVNPKNSRDSYVSNENSSLSDYYICSVSDRNRALDGDQVVLRVKPESEWSEGKRTVTVVYILEKIHPRTTVGVLKPMEEIKDFAAFYPRDKRMPVMLIPSVSWPNGFKTNTTLYQKILFAATLVEWTEPDMALGVITEALGLSGDLKVENSSILKEFCLDATGFSPEILESLPKLKEIRPEDLEDREDIRKECVFTIDPLTARDLDDAVSVKELPNGNFEIGVHISDASYYLHEGTPLDKKVSEKATTIYVVDNVYHMLPVELCLHCSLLPGEDKLAFSVFWEMNGQGDIFNTRFARTVLNSCTKLAYEHAQQMIESPEKEFTTDELPQIYNGFTCKDLSKTVNVLQQIAINLRDVRMKNGALRIDQVKLLFSLDPRHGEPLDFIVYENKESHRLIEEFMLLANISVATKIRDTFPEIAFLRCHEPPKATMLMEAQKSLETCGIHIDISSSGNIHSSLRKYITGDYQGFCRGIVLNHIFAKPMTRARYFCSAMMETEAEYAHYALSVPIYTHFTSPIRRYADIMVHRLLAASLGYADRPNWDIDQVCAIAANCNKQKYNAKRAGEASSDLYLAHYIEKHQPYIQDCVVVDVKDRAFDAIVLKTGSLIRVYQRKCEDNPSWHIQAIPSSTGRTEKPNDFTKKVLRLTIKFPKTKKTREEQSVVVEMFSVVKVKLQRVPNSYKLEAFLLRPIISKTFQRSSNSPSRPRK